MPLKKTFTLASVVGLTGAVAFTASVIACGDDDTGASTSSSGGSTSGATSSGSSSGASSSGSTSGSTTSSSGGVSLKDANDVPGVNVVYGKCEAFTKCDGKVEGNWTVTGGCLPDNTFDQFKEACKGVQEHDIVIKVSGDVSADAATIKQSTTIYVSAGLDIPVGCATLAGGCDGLPAFLQGGFGGAAFDKASCVADGDFCKCIGEVQITEDNQPDPYKTDGAGVLTSENPTRTFEYCPKGGNITYRETTKNAKSFQMLLTIGPK